MKKILFLVIACLLLSLAPIVRAEDNKINVVIFTQTGCQYCARTWEHLNSVKDKYPGMTIQEFDIRKDPTYFQTFTDYRRAYGSTSEATPTIFIGNKVIEGALLEEIDAALDNCQKQQCVNPNDVVAKFIKDNPTAEQQKSKDKTIIGWMVIGVVVAGGGILLLSKN